MLKEILQFFVGNPQEQTVLQERNCLRAQGSLSRRAEWRLQDLEEDAGPITRRLLWRRVGAIVGVAGVGGIIVAVRSLQASEPGPNSGFEKTTFTKARITVPKPVGWTVLEIQATPNLINCYVSKQPITREEDFRNGLRVSKLNVPFNEQGRIVYARQLASQPEIGLLPLANTFKEARIGSFRIFSGRFNSTRNNILSEEERKIVVPDNSNIVYIAVFTTPKPTADEDFKRFGRQMLDGIIIDGKPTR